VERATVRRREYGRLQLGVRRIGCRGDLGKVRGGQSLYLPETGGMRVGERGPSPQRNAEPDHGMEPTRRPARLRPGVGLPSNVL